MGVTVIARESVPFRDPLQIDAEEFVALGIDDLAKYRIVGFLCASPGICWEARLYAECLGLRPIERTMSLLEELVARHILERYNTNDLPRYKLTTDKGIRRHLTRLFTMAQTRPYHARILTRLAARSLERIRANVGNKKRGQCSSSEFGDKATVKQKRQSYALAPVEVIREKSYEFAVEPVTVSTGETIISMHGPGRASYNADGNGLLLRQPF